MAGEFSSKDPKKQPDWFLLIANWKVKNMGQNGVTLAFLVGALCHQLRKSIVTRDDVRNLLREIVNNPVSGYVTRVKWCNVIGAPVLSVLEVDSSNHIFLE